ncbi:MAG: toxic anion resistance protein [Bacteroidota bacterium]
MTAENDSSEKELKIIELNKLEPAQIEKAKDIALSIDVSDSQSVIQYGIGAQSRISEFSDSVLSKVRSKDSGYIGETLTDLGTQVKSMRIEKLGSNSVFSKIPLLGGLVNSIQRFMSRYEKVSTQIEKIVTELEKARMELIKDITMLDTLYDKNLEYLSELDLFIAAGQIKLRELRDVVLPEMQKHVEKSDDPSEAQKFRDFTQMVDRFEKKIYDLKLSRTISLQTAPQLRLIQNNDQLLVEKIQSSILNTIPLWKNQMVIAISLFRQKNALEMQKSITKTTNDLLSRNSEMLKEGSLETARESEKGIVEIETLKKVNDDLISTIDETLSIQKEGRIKRQQAEGELAKIESELKLKLKAVAQNS